MTLERAAERCINVLLELINYVVQEAVVVIKDIFRRYPNRRACCLTGFMLEPFARVC